MLHIQVEPGKPGAEISKGKPTNYTPKKEFVYRIVSGLVVFPWCVGGGDFKNHVMWCGEMWSDVEM